MSFSTLTKRTTPYPSIDPTLKEHSYAGKTILITAGATGVGASIARAFCLAGCKRLILSSRNQHTLQQSQERLQRNFKGTRIDISPVFLDDASSIDQLWSGLTDTVDIVVLSAAHSPKRGASMTIEVEDAAQTMQTNVVGNWNMAKHYIAHCQERSIRGTIIDISSGAAHWTNGRNSVYGASKAGATILLRALCMENKTNIRLFSLHPGMVFSPMAEKAGYKRSDLPVDDDALVGSFVVWLGSGHKDWLENRFLWATWDVDELVGRKGDLARDEDLLTLGLIGWQ